MNLWKSSAAILVLGWVLFLLPGCSASKKAEILTSEAVPTNIDKIILLNTVARFESKIFKGFGDLGIEVFREQPKGGVVPFGIRLTPGGLSNWCLINDNIQYRNFTYTLENLQTNQPIAMVSKGGWTGSCAYHSGDLFGELPSLMLKLLEAQGTVALEEWVRVSVAKKPSSGTGFFVSKTGYILTAYHVIDGFDAITVTRHDGVEFTAKLVQGSKSSDLALLKVEVDDADYLDFNLAGSAKLGQPVYTIGYPASSILGQEQKYTNGTISSLSGLGGDLMFLQASVPVQPGNSGGPLLGETGNVLGVVTSTAAVAEFFRQTGALPQNIMWAIKASYAVPLIPAEDLIDQDREMSIEEVQRAVCFIEVVRQ